MFGDKDDFNDLNDFKYIKFLLDFSTFVCLFQFKFLNNNFCHLFNKLTIYKFIKVIEKG